MRKRLSLWIDLIVPHRDGGQSYVYLTGPEVTYSKAKRVAFGKHDATIRMTEAADLDGDGWLDILAIDDERRSVTIYFGQKDDAFSSGVSIDNGAAIPYALMIEDLDGDEKPISSSVMSARRRLSSSTTARVVDTYPFALALARARYTASQPQIWTAMACWTSLSRDLTLHVIYFAQRPSAGVH